MTVIKNQKSNTYEVRTYYKDWTGVRKQKTKRGFKRKCDAQEWERAFKLKENLSLDMYFEDFVDLYLNDIKSRIKYNTWLTKKHIVEKKILPYFSKKKLQEIKPSDIRQWQNTMMNYRNKQGEGYSQVYLKTIHNQLSAILNHAVNFYDLKSNAARKAGSMGKERTKEMLFWTKEEYMKFIEAVADKPISFYAFEILYWCGVRMGELLALTPADFDFQACTIRINKSYQRLEGKDIITDPKTVKSNRMITMPEFLSEELESYATNDIIRRITRYAAQLSEKNALGANRKEEYRKVAELFLKCQDMEEAHKMSAMVFGMECPQHIAGDLVRETDSMNIGVYEEQPMEISLKPRIRTYREKSRRSAIRESAEQKQETRRKMLEKQREEMEKLQALEVNGRIHFGELPVLEPRIREILLKWLSDAMESADFSARTDDGRRYILDRSRADETCVVHCLDGNFTMPDLSIVFQEET